LCAAIVDRRDTFPARPFSTAVNMELIGSEPAGEQSGQATAESPRESAFKSLRDMCGIVAMGTMIWKGEEERRRVFKSSQFLPLDPPVKSLAGRSSSLRKTRP
jgi:hypothetical protein